MPPAPDAAAFANGVAWNGFNIAIMLLIVDARAAAAGDGVKVDRLLYMERAKPINDTGKAMGFASLYRTESEGRRPRL